MKILALEFSSSRRSVAVLSFDGSGKLLAQGEAIETGGRTTRAIGMIEAALRQAQIEREQVDRLAIGLGPGSYHGIRTAIALAQGWQLARKLDVIGISSAEVLAEQARDEGVTGNVDIVIDAHRNEFYITRYSIIENLVAETQSLRLASSEEIQSKRQQPVTLLGPDLPDVVPTARPLFPSAALLGRLARTGTPAQDASRLEPIYLRTTSFVKVLRPSNSRNP
jgi:tRNA threonylcarbamoyladenosine biosynthesis protein TsaB